MYMHPSPVRCFVREPHPASLHLLMFLGPTRKPIPTSRHKPPVPVRLSLRRRQLSEHPLQQPPLVVRQLLRLDRLDDVLYHRLGRQRRVAQQPRHVVGVEILVAVPQVVRPQRGHGSGDYTACAERPRRRRLLRRRGGAAVLGVDLGRSRHRRRCRGAAAVGIGRSRSQSRRPGEDPLLRPELSLLDAGVPRRRGGDGFLHRLALGRGLVDGGEKLLS
ncbi:hypothetical protein B0T18DRAFT_82385 [Schizothecium vesticola]|uniref:Uncharacterized protein n=1 Tax=Schizothecium vesticola TaxID=314040 RepID=A0AA40KAT4_9PEZI|nr:hypothetical protein B0T18DRAFT_82385 [Schizothecium vesticola]